MSLTVCFGSCFALLTFLISFLCLHFSCVIKYYLGATGPEQFRKKNHVHTGDVFCTAPLILLKMFFCEPRSDITERDDRRRQVKKKRNIQEKK